MASCGSYSDDSAINNAGQAVGSTYTTQGLPHAFITDLNGGAWPPQLLIDLPEGIVLTNAVDISNAGQVIVIAQVLPEPEAYYAPARTAVDWMHGAARAFRRGEAA